MALSINCGAYYWSAANFGLIRGINRSWYKKARVLLLILELVSDDKNAGEPQNLIVYSSSFWSYIQHFCIFCYYFISTLFYFSFFLYNNLCFIIPSFFFINLYLKPLWWLFRYIGRIASVNFVFLYCQCFPMVFFHVTVIVMFNRK